MTARLQAQPCSVPALSPDAEETTKWREEADNHRCSLHKRTLIVNSSRQLGGSGNAGQVDAFGPSTICQPRVDLALKSSKRVDARSPKVIAFGQLNGPGLRSGLGRPGADGRRRGEDVGRAVQDEGMLAVRRTGGCRRKDQRRREGRRQEPADRQGLEKHCGEHDRANVASKEIRLDSLAIRAACKSSSSARQASALE
jgi:hypothetical protein